MRTSLGAVLGSLILHWGRHSGAIDDQDDQIIGVGVYELGYGGELPFDWLLAGSGTGRS